MRSASASSGDTIESTFYGLANFEFVFNDFRVPAAAINVIWFSSSSG
ncbi:MAG: hypothetical protein IPK28_10085 [Devosia sp.]|nr:hypothetical protein [Devosia sp.]